MKSYNLLRPKRVELDARRSIAVEKNGGLTEEHERYCPVILTSRMIFTASSI